MALEFTTLNNKKTETSIESKQSTVYLIALSLVLLLVTAIFLVIKVAVAT